METRLIKIGNSRGVRLPSQLLTEFADNTAFNVIKQGDSLILSPKKNQRENWVSQMKKENGDDTDFLLNDFDEKDWEW